MANSFKIPTSTIKQVNPLAEEKQQYYMKKDTAPGAGPLSIPKEQASPLHTAPQNFEKLRKALLRK